ncbi:MAG: hypothetical protein VW929_01305 [Actinomycetota bacterium]
MELTKDRVVKKSLMRAGRKAAVAAGTAVAMAASLITVAPTAHASLTNQDGTAVTLTWSETINSNAKRTGAIRPPSPLRQMIRGDIASIGQVRVSDGAYLTRSDVYLDRCTTTNASTCTVIASDIDIYSPARAGRIGIRNRVEYTPDYSVDGGKYLRLRYRAVGVDDAGRNSESNYSSGYLYLVPPTPQATALPTLMSTLAGTPATEIDASAPFTMTTDPWTLNANGSFDLIGGLYACESDNAGQVATYDWDQTGCSLLSEHESAPGEREFSGDLIKDYVGKYLLAVTVARHKDWSRSGTTELIQVRSGTYLITKTDVGAQAPGNAQPAQQQNQQNQGAAQQAFAAAAPTGAAAVRLRTPQAPLVSSTGTGSASGTDLTVRSPAVQQRGKRKKSYRAIVDPQYRGRVAFVLTRTTPKGKMIVAKSRVKNTNKKGRAKIRWKFANKKPPGTYTLYVSFIPKARYNKPGLTVAKPVELR